jgi:hypothetical protein
MVGENLNMCTWSDDFDRHLHICSDMFPSSFSIKSIYYYEGNTNYTQPLQQCSALEQYGCTQPKKKRIIKKKSPATVINFL